jgi:hypothetical protein
VSIRLLIDWLKVRFSRKTTPLYPHANNSASLHFALFGCQPLCEMSFSYNKLSTHNPKVVGSNPTPATI